MDSIFKALLEKWKKSTVDKGGLKYLSFQKSMIRAGVRQVVINEDCLLQSNPDSLEISIRIVGTPPSLRRLHYYIKFKWDIQAPHSMHNYIKGTPSRSSLQQYQTTCKQRTGHGASSTIVL